MLNGAIKGKKYVEMIKNMVAKKSTIHNVRLSCFHEVWQKWCGSESTEEFDKWLHDKMHEA